MGCGASSPSEGDKESTKGRKDRRSRSSAKYSASPSKGAIQDQDNVESPPLPPPPPPAPEPAPTPPASLSPRRRQSFAEPLLSHSLSSESADETTPIQCVTPLYPTDVDQELPTFQESMLVEGEMSINLQDVSGSSDFATIILQKVTEVLNYIESQRLDKDDTVAKSFAQSLCQFPVVYQNAVKNALQKKMACKEERESFDSVTSIEGLCMDESQKHFVRRRSRVSCVVRASSVVDDEDSSQGENSCRRRRRSLCSSPPMSVVSGKSAVSHVLSEIANGRISIRTRETLLVPEKVEETSAPPLESLLLSAAELSRYSMDLVQLTASVSREAKQLLNSESCTVWTLRGQCLTTFVSYTTGASSDISGQDAQNGFYKTERLLLSSLYEHSPEKDVFNTRQPVHFRKEFDFGTKCHHSEQHEVSEALYYPICFEGTLLGICKCTNKVRSHDIDFTEDSENLLGSLLVFVAVMCQNAFLCEDLRESIGDTQQLLQMSRDVSACRMMKEDLCATIIETAQQIVNAESCRLFLVDAEKKFLVTQVSVSTGSLSPKSMQEVRYSAGGDLFEVKIPVDNGIEGLVYNTGVSVNLADASEHEAFDFTIDKVTKKKTRSVLCVPVVCDGVTIAVAQLVNKEEGDEMFSEKDQKMFQDFSSFCGNSIRNVQNHEEVQRKQQITKLFASTIHEVQQVDSTDIGQICDKILTGVCELVHCERANIWIVNKEYDTLQSICGTSSAPLSSTVAGLTVASRETKRYRDVLAETTQAKEDTLLNCTPWLQPTSVISIPLLSLDNEVIAVAQLVNRIGSFFTDEDEEILNLYSNFAAMCLRNATLIEFMKAASEAHSNLVKVMAMDAPIAGTRRSSLHAVPGAANLDVSLLAYFNVELTEEEKLTAPTRGFAVHDYKIKQESHVRLPKVCAFLIERYGAYEKFNTSEDRVMRFILAVKRKYRHVNYHNFTHAFDVMQAVVCSLDCLPENKYITDLDKFALLITGMPEDLMLS